MALVLSLPISNLFIKREYLASNDDPEFKAVSDILVKKCADCHTNDVAHYPVYFSFPISEAIIHNNIKRGQASFILGKNKLSGKEKFSSSDVLRLSQAMAKNNMPPVQYILLHWDSALSSSEQMTLVSWIQKRQKEFDIRPIPAANFFRPDSKKAELGEKLFNEKLLSSDNTTSCATCHALDNGGTDHLKVANRFNDPRGNLNTPTVFNAAYNITQFWDGRVKSLKAQAEAAITDPREMNSNFGHAIENLQKDKQYVDSFKASYSDGITSDNICDAIAEFELTLLTPGSRFDKYLAGDQSAISQDEKDGFEIFKKSECYTCHTGPAFGGLSYRRLGAEKDYYESKHNLTEADNGRYNVTHNAADMHRFKIPMLRNVELTAPYFHDGSAATLEDAVKIMSEYQIQKPLSESEQKKVVAFLKSLSGTYKGKQLELRTKQDKQ